MIIGDGVWVADVIMGGGKTSAAFNYINKSDDERFVFLTPFEPEFTRVVEACKPKHFVTPVKVRGAKINDLKAILKNGINVATSHALFEMYTPEMLESIRENEYTLFMDEVYSVIRDATPKEAVTLMWYLERGYVCVDKSSRQLGLACEQEDLPPGLDGMIDRVLAGQIYMSDDKLLVWQLPPDVLRSFKKVVILTYLFEFQELKYYLQHNGMAYQYIGTRKDRLGLFEFCQTEDADDFARGVSGRIHILDNKKLNHIGESDFSLTSGWSSKERYGNKSSGIEVLGKNVRNVQKNIFGCSTKDFIWTCLKDKDYAVISDKNIHKGFVAWNKKAINGYGDRHYAAYVVNPYMSPRMKKHLAFLGGTVDEGGWALSCMVQWIWRSAIRNGEDIWIYIPSKRMRNLLINWLEELEREES